MGFGAPHVWAQVLEVCAEEDFHHPPRGHPATENHRWGTERNLRGNLEELKVTSFLFSVF